MSKQKMHCDLRRSSSDRPKVSDKGKGFSSRKSLEQNLKASIEERQAASIICGNPNLRHCIVKFLIVKPDGHWGLLALPILCPGNSNYLRCGTQPKTDDFIMVSPPVDSFKAGQRKGGTSSLTDGHHQSGKPTRLDEFSKCDTAGTISDDFDAVNSSGASSDSSKARKNAKKNAKRKARKKAKRKNKRSSETGSTGLETLSEECAVGSSTSESSINNDIDRRDETVSSPDRLVTANDSGGESNGITNRSETSETSTSETSDMDVSEDTGSSVIAFNSEDGAGFSISKGSNDEHGKTIHDSEAAHRSTSDDCVGEEDVNCFQLDKVSKCNNGEANLASNSEDTNRSEVKFFPGNRQSRRRSFSTKAGSKASARMNIQENEFSVFPELGNVRKGSGSVSQSRSRNNFPEPESQTNGDESVTSELDRIESRDSLNTTNLHEQQSAVHLRPLIGEEVAEPDEEASPSENGEQEHSSASVMRKWKPVLEKDSGFANNSVDENPSPDYQKQISSNEFEIMRVDRRSGNANRSSPSENSEQEHSSASVLRKWKPVLEKDSGFANNSVEENPSPDYQKQISSNEFEIMRVDRRSGNANRSSPDDKSPVQRTCTPKQVNCSTDARKEKHVYSFRADSRKNSVEENPSPDYQKQISSNEFEIMRDDHRSGNANRSSPDDKSSVQNACTPKQLNCSTDARKEKHVYSFRADSSKNSVEENPSPDYQKQISSNESEIMRVDHRSGNANRSSPDDKSSVQNACTPKQVNCSTDARKEKHVYSFRADSSKNSVEENPSPDYQKQISSNEFEIMRVDHRSGNANRSSPDDKSSVQNACTPKQVNCSTDARKEKHVYAFQADSSKNSVEENPSEISLNESEIMRVDHRSGNANRSSPESPVLNACTPKQVNSSTDARKEKHVYPFRADSSKNSVEENPSEISSNESEIMRVDHRSGTANRSSPDDKSPVQNACTPKQVNRSTDPRKEKHVYPFRADSSKNSVEENPSEISLNESEIMRVDHRSGTANRSSPDDKSPVQNACTPKQVNRSTDPRKEKHVYPFRADSSKNSVEENPSEISLNESEIMRVDHRSGTANRSSPDDKSSVQNACTPKQVNRSTDAHKEKHVYSFRADSSKNSVEENPSEISLNESEIMRVDHRSGNANRSSPEDKSPVLNACTPKQVNRSTDARKEKHVYSFRADSSEISGALHDSYRVQQLSESVHLATGNPIAEFEKLLHAASPIICRSNVVNICRTCSQDEVGRPLCPHEVPDIALKSLWKWYEKQSSYGLGVRLADNDHSMRSGFRQSRVQAYFVPYLSAVQLFKKPENRRMNNGHVDSRTCEVNKTSERSSNVGHLPIFKVLVPRPENQMYSSQGSSMSESVDAATTDDLEILFEYFESDPPQLRKPLFEKIRELVRGDGPSMYKPYGDPTKLESMNLDELHRSSWYSVAWYPIYRIPDGEFRAAFLTYHSFCHLVRRGSSSDSRRKDACIVSPVVGLQSYSAQRERWFDLKRSIPGKKEETSSLKPSEILRDRLKTLEQTSSLLARAEVRKGKVRSMNRHPDFEFFVSRRRW